MNKETRNTMPTFLVVNDDGYDSPLLRPLVERLMEVGDVRVAVPLHENSWKGKALTRHGHLKVKELKDFPCPAYAIEGTPSDCANMGIYNLFDEQPDWVVSGINLGVNAGVSFVINSGTIGAAFEGALTGIPGVALSVCMEPELYGQWLNERKLSGPLAEKMIAETTTRSAQMMQTISTRGLPEGAMLLNINFPEGLDAKTPAKWTPILDNRYGSLFERSGDGFVFSYRRGDAWRSEQEGDKSVVESGTISVTPLSLMGLSAPLHDSYSL